MKFGKRYSKMTVFKAMIHGVFIGIAGVTLVGLLLWGLKGKDSSSASETEVPTAGPAPVEVSAPVEEKPLQLFAKQHGVFTTSAAAAQFIGEDPFLAKAAVVQVNDKYYVWTAVGLTENEIEASESEGTFRKVFSANASSCGASGAGKLREVLSETEIAKIKNLASDQNDGNEETDTKDFNKNIAAITAFTHDLRIIRLHLLSHYSSTDKCVEISF